MTAFERRRLLTAELLSIGSELTVGETRDTNAGELARSLTGMGVRVTRLTALPDDLDQVTDAFTTGLGRADLVVSTGGLGPTPDDLTREAIAAACGETPEVDAGLEAWLRDLWSRRGMPFPELNLKQAWLIPSAEALPNPNGTAPGWFVDRPDGRVIVALPGPPREMRPMWADHVVPRLQRYGSRCRGRRRGPTGWRGSASRRSPTCSATRSCGRPTRSSRPTRASRPSMSGSRPSPKPAGVPTSWSRPRRPSSSATSAITSGRPARRPGARRSARGSASSAGRWPWSRSGPAAVSARCSATSRGSASTNRSRPSRRPPGRTAATTQADDGADDPTTARRRRPHGSDELVAFARRARELGGADVGIAVRTRPRTGDTAVSIAIVTPLGERRVRRLVFLTGPMGRSRAALAAAAVLLETLRDPDATD